MRDDNGITKRARITETTRGHDEQRVFFLVIFVAFVIFVMRSS
jgi:hypothetical protein